MQRAFLGDDELEEIKQVAGIQCARVSRHQRGNVGLADQRHAVLDDGLVRLGQRAVAALRGGQVDDYAARLHGHDHLFGHQHGRGTAGNQGGSDHHVGLRHALGDFDLLPGHPARRHRLGIAAHADSGFALLVGFVRHVDELAAQRLDLLLDAGPHVAGLDYRAQSLGRGNRLQAGHADPQNHHAGGLDGAGGGHQHWEEALVFIGRHHDGLVAGDVGLRRQHVHALGSTGARRRFKRKGSQLPCGQALQAGGIERIEHADHHAAGPGVRHLAVQRAAHLEHDVGSVSARGIGDLDPCRAVGVIGNAGGHASARLNANDMALGFELFRRFGRDGHTCFSGHDFGGYPNQHGGLLFVFVWGRTAGKLLQHFPWLAAYMRFSQIGRALFILFRSVAIPAPGGPSRTLKMLLNK